ncbi:MAG: RDD family protein [Cytophagales bacterium]|nr:RDD family protein [Bernardetiaceae bacterium]MDW8211556.1 RDD family protein [Cytophagales bacterium]
MEEEYVLATPAQRFLEALIDAFFIFILALLLTTISARLIKLAYLISIIYNLTKDAIPALNGQSIGKRLLKIRVIKQDTYKPITGDWATAIVRGIPQQIPIFNLVDALMVFSTNRQRLGDRWAKTIVVQER